MVLRAGWLLVAVCFVSQASARTAVTVLNKDYSYVPAKMLLAANMRSVLESMSGLQAVHPRLQRLYALLQRELRAGPHHGQLHHAINLTKALKPSAYGANKLNRIFTTTPDWVA